jgi:hypothetical protein
MARIATLSFCAALAWGGALQAGTAFDLVFPSGTLDGLPEGTELHYDGEGMPEATSGEDWSELVVGLAPEDRAVVEGRMAGGEGPPRVLGSFPAAVGNPIAMVFLEQVVNSIAEQTGGSPFYIRNRIRDALGGPGEIGPVMVAWRGEEVPATEIALLPFAEDAQRAELGAFADLEIRVLVSEAVPGWYVSIRAEAPGAASEPAYAASFSLIEVEP